MQFQKFQTWFAPMVAFFFIFTLPPITATLNHKHFNSQVTTLLHSLKVHRSTPAQVNLDNIINTPTDILPDFISSFDSSVGRPSQDLAFCGPDSPPPNIFSPETNHISKRIKRHHLHHHPSPPPSTEPTQLRIATYNLWNSDDGPDWPSRVQIEMDVIQQLSADVIIVQEVRRPVGIFGIGNDMFADLCNLLTNNRSAPIHFRLGVFRSSAAYSFGLRTEGVAIFTRLPADLVESTFLHFIPSPNNADLNPRAALALHIRNVWVIGTHLSYSSPEQAENLASLYLFVRAVVADSAIRFGNCMRQHYPPMASKCSRLEGIVIGADWNMPNENDPNLIDFVSKLGVVDAYQRMPTPSPPTYCNCKSNPQEFCSLYERIDRIFFWAQGPTKTENLIKDQTTNRGLLVRNFCPSDHAAVAATLAR